LKQIDLYQLNGEPRSQCPYCGQISMYRMVQDTLSIKITCPHLVGVQKNISGDYCHAFYSMPNAMPKK